MFENFGFNWRSMINRLIAVNIAIFLVYRIVLSFVGIAGLTSAVNALEQFTLHHFMLSSEWDLVLRRPWTLITHAFFHRDLWHLLMNVLCLYGFGRITEDLVGFRRILPIYLFGALGGGILFILAFTVLPNFHALNGVAFGASGAVMAIMAAAVTFAPQYEINLLLIGRIRLLWVVIGMGVIDFINIPMGNAGGHIAHLGGALLGWFYAFQLQKGRDLASPFYWLLDKLSTIFQPKPKNRKPVYRRMQADNEIKEKRQEEKVNIILEKISKSGYESLSKEEKDFLFNISNKK